MTFVVGLLMVASLGVCFYFFWRLLRYGQVLSYVPRRRVPWGRWGAFVAVAMTFLAVSTALSQRLSPPADAPPTATSAEFAERIAILASIYLLLTAGLVALLVVGCRATREDLGLPGSLRQWGADIGLGLMLGLALLVPVMTIQALCVYLLGVEAAHPVLDRIQEGPDLLVIVGAMLAATVAAPIFEEVVFRLLLIGALERWEDETIDWPYSKPARRRGFGDLFSETPPEEMGAPPAEGVDEGADFATEPPEEQPLETIAGEPPLVAPGAIFGLSHGWFPILVSALLFSLAHLGQGPSPIPLLVFGMILGYAYQRTHRLVPCIVAHLVFNAISIALLVGTLLAGQPAP